jgi:hypothetical protein
MSATLSALDGIGPPRDHQARASWMVANAALVLLPLGIEAIAAPRADESNPDSKVPDVGFYLPQSYSPDVVVEISGSRNSLYEFGGKLREYELRYRDRQYRFRELFHWNLLSSQIDRYRFGFTGNRFSMRCDREESFSEVIAYDLRILGLFPLEFQARIGLR